MESIAYLVASSFPFWAIPLAIILLELANRNRLRRDTKKAFVAFSFAMILIMGTGLFFYLGGHKNIAPAFRMIRGAESRSY